MTLKAKSGKIQIINAADITPLKKKFAENLSGLMNEWRHESASLAYLSCTNMVRTSFLLGNFEKFSLCNHVSWVDKLAGRELQRIQAHWCSVRDQQSARLILLLEVA